jgi:hypothetical protein
MSNNDLLHENSQLHEEINQYKIVIQNLQKDITKMKPFVELTKTIHKENPEIWEYYATKTIQNKKH